MQMKFELNSTLAKDSIFIAELALSQARLINNTDYPWIILVPQLPNITEITDLGSEEYNILNQEIRAIAKIMQSEFTPDKLNIAMIGNMVPQLHVHIIARFKNDKLFPKPVWGCEFTPYQEKEAQERIRIILKKL
jgi:diadenosine tetraphosphate (Ap4A) HIT family hydrolase